MRSTAVQGRGHRINIQSKLLEATERRFDRTINSKTNHELVTA